MGNDVPVPLTRIQIGLEPNTRALLERFVVAFEKFVTQPPAAAPAASGAPTFPFGKNKGASIVGASPNDLRWHAEKAMQDLNDPSKARFHARTRDWFAALNAELVRQGQAPVEPPDAPADGPSDDGGGDYGDAPPDDGIEF